LELKFNKLIHLNKRTSEKKEKRKEKAEGAQEPSDPAKEYQYERPCKQKQKNSR